MRHTLQRGTIAILMLLVVVIVVTALEHEQRIFHPLALALNDYKSRLLSLPKESENNVVVVTLDEKSIAQYGRWPWSRTVLASLFDRLAQADLVGVDIIFAEPSDPASDQALTEAFKRSGNVVAGFFFRGSSMVADAPFSNIEECALAQINDDVRLELREYEHLDTNLDALQRAAYSCAAFTIEPEMDGLYRRYSMGYAYHGMVFPTMAAQLYQLKSGKFLLPVQSDGEVRFLAGDEQSYPASLALNFVHKPLHISAADVLNGTIPATYFKNRIVLLGATEEGIYDLRPTPFAKTTPGIDVHYTALLNLLNADYLVVDKSNTRGFSWGVLILMLGGLWLTSVKRRLAVYALIGVAGVITSIVLHSNYMVVYDFYWLTQLFFSALIVEIASILWLEKDSRFMKKAFASYVSDELVDTIVSDPKQVELGGVEKEITILFSDMRNFTAISETLRPKELVTLLNQIFEPSTRAILDNQGMLDKYIGDAIMAIFNAPVPVEDHPVRACHAALAMARAIDKLGKELGTTGKPPIAVGIGINTGLAVVGNMGSTLRFSYTAIGDSVNLASRIEGLNKYYGTVVLVSEMTRDRVADEFLCRKVDRIVVKGKSEPIDIYELMEDDERSRTVTRAYESAIELYFTRQFAEALQQFEELVRLYDDGPAKVLVERCHEFMTTPPSDTWVGEFVMSGK